MSVIKKLSTIMGKELQEDWSTLYFVIRKCVKNFPKLYFNPALTQIEKNIVTTTDKYKNASTNETRADIERHLAHATADMKLHVQMFGLYADSHDNKSSEDQLIHGKQLKNLLDQMNFPVKSQSEIQTMIKECVQKLASVCDATPTRSVQKMIQMRNNVINITSCQQELMKQTQLIEIAVLDYIQLIGIYGNENGLLNDEEELEQEIINLQNKTPKDKIQKLEDEEADFISTTGEDPLLSELKSIEDYLKYFRPLLNDNSQKFDDHEKFIIKWLIYILDCPGVQESSSYKETCSDQNIECAVSVSEEMNLQIYEYQIRSSIIDCCKYMNNDNKCTELRTKSQKQINP